MKTIIMMLLLLVMSCASPTWTSIGYKTESVEMVLDLHLLDSLYTTDLLNGEWISTPIVDYENGNAIDKRMYIKDSIVYTILFTDSCYYLEKRVKK